MANSPFSDPQPFPPVESAQPAPKRAAWSPRALLWTCLTLSIVPAGIMYALNFDRLGAPEKKKPALIGVLVFSFVLYGIMIVASVKPEWLPSFNDGLLRIISATATLSMARYFCITQQALFEQHLSKGGKKASVWPAYLWSIGAIAIVLFSIFGYSTWEVTQDDKAFDKALTLMQDGKLDEAETIFKDYRVKYPDEAAVHFNLGLIYAAKDHLPAAKKELQETLRLDPNFKNAKKFLNDVETDMKAEAQR